MTCVARGGVHYRLDGAWWPTQPALPLAHDMRPALPHYALLAPDEKPDGGPSGEMDEARNVKTPHGVAPVTVPTHVLTQVRPRPVQDDPDGVWAERARGAFCRADARVACFGSDRVLELCGWMREHQQLRGGLFLLQQRLLSAVIVVVHMLPRHIVWYALTPTLRER
jgi:hypothetical protein